MKRLIFYVLLATLYCSCLEKENVSRSNTEFIVTHYTAPLIIVEVDSCEYFLGEWGNATVLTHKGNCKFCINRK